MMSNVAVFAPKTLYRGRMLVPRCILIDQGIERLEEGHVVLFTSHSYT